MVPRVLAIPQNSEERSDIVCRCQIDQVGEPIGDRFEIDLALVYAERWSSEKRALKGLGDLEAAFRFLETLGATIVFWDGPLRESDQVYNLNAAIENSISDLVEGSAVSDEPINFLDPGLYSVVAGRGSRVDCIEDGGTLAANGAGVKAELEMGHSSGEVKSEKWTVDRSPS